MYIITLILDIVTVSGEAIAHFYRAEPLLFFGVLLVAAAASVGGWTGLARFCLRFNRCYMLGRWHHVAALVVAFGSVVIFCAIPSYSRLAEVEVRRINDWIGSVPTDQTLARNAFVAADHAARGLALEDFKGFPSVEQGGSLIPMNHRETRVAVAVAYVRTLETDFAEQLPFEARCFGNPERDQVQMARKDVEDYFKSGKQKVYPLSRAIALISDAKRSDAVRKVPQLITILQAVAGLVFLALWAATYGVFGWLAYRALNQDSFSGIMADRKAAALAGH